MKSLLVEFHRFNDLNTGFLRKDDPYIVAAASHPVRQPKMPIGHRKFMKHMKALRYQSSADARQKALEKMGTVTTELIGEDFVAGLTDGEGLLQLDLVVNAVELAGLPFEAIRDKNGTPLISRADVAIELTRRVRSDFAESSVKWPAKPRILLAWASPRGVGAVPHKEHKETLTKILEPWIPVQDETASEAQDTDKALTILEEVDLPALKKACQEAIENKKPYTHVHLLAHGYPVEPDDEDDEEIFGVAFHNEKGKLHAVTPEEIKEALEPLSHYPVVVTLAICDAGNDANSLIPERSIAHELHVSGFPVVVASQLPLTVPGSNLIVNDFYGALMAGKDVREALHETRVHLYENRAKNGHDWASMVGYVRLPEGYADHLLEVGLERVLASLNRAQAWSDQLVKNKEENLKQYNKVEKLLSTCINDLERFLKDEDSQNRKGIREENLGLLGSAKKRLAELYFKHGKINQEDDSRPLMRNALQEAGERYGESYKQNLSHHWTGVQYLSLEAVLTGKISDPNYWTTAVTAARFACENPEEYWALGSLAELYLLAPLAKQESQLEDASAALTQLKDRVKKHSDCGNFPIESTQRQLQRYVDWWTTANDFFPGADDLATDANHLLTVLQQ